MPAPEQPVLDLASLSRFLQRSLGTAGELQVERIGAGQLNPTFFID